MRCSRCNKPWNGQLTGKEPPIVLGPGRVRCRHCSEPIDVRCIACGVPVEEERMAGGSTSCKVCSPAVGRRYWGSITDLHRLNVEESNRARHARLRGRPAERDEGEPSSLADHEKRRACCTTCGASVLLASSGARVRRCPACVPRKTGP